MSITGGVCDNDPGGGNGIAWSIDLFHNSTNTTLTSGSYPNGGSQLFSAGSGGSSITNIAISPGDVLYFVVDPNGDYNCDSTGLDVTINAAPQANVPEAPLGATAIFSGRYLGLMT